MKSQHPTLKAYVRATILDAAMDNVPDWTASTCEDRLEALKSAIRDASKGTDTGWWNDLIWNADAYALADQYRVDIAQQLLDGWQNGESLTYPNEPYDGALIALACTLAPKSLEDDYFAQPDLSGALEYGLRRAIMSLVSDLEMAVENEYEEELEAK